MRNVYFGKVTDPNTVDVNGDGLIQAQVINGQAVETEHPVWGGRVVTDLSVGYKFNKSIRLTVGANNIFDVYPDLNYGPVNAKDHLVLMLTEILLIRQHLQQLIFPIRISLYTPEMYLSLV